MPRSYCLPLLILTCALASACGREAAPADCEPEGGSVVGNVGPGRWADAQLQPHLEELWRVGATEVGLGYPAALAASRSGRLAVADFERDRVFVFGEDRHTLGSWPHEHSVGKPIALTWDASEHLYIFDLGASTLLTVNSEGQLLREVPLSQAFLNETMQAGGLDWAGVLPGGTVYFQPLAPIDPEAPDPGQSVWTLWQQQAGRQQVDTLIRAPARLFGYTMRAGTPVPTWPRLRTASGGNGLLAVGGEDGSYRIRLFQADGTRLRTICRDAAPLPQTPQERGDVEREIDANLLREAPQPTTLAPFGHLFLGAEGELWVQRDRPFVVTDDPYTAVHGNPGGLYDVFDAEGRYLGELRAPAAVRLRAAAGERVWGIETPDAGEVYLVAYRLTLR
jgi:hypothetical protein